MGVFGKLLNNKKREVKAMNDEWRKDSDLEFITFPNKGIVVCKIHNCAFVPLIRISKYTTDEEACYEDKYIIPDTFVGVARCNPDDAWDEAYGKKLALVKAKAKRCRAVNNAINQYIRDKEKELKTLRQYGIRNIPDPKQV